MPSWLETGLEELQRRLGAIEARADLVGRRSERMRGLWTFWSGYGGPTKPPGVRTQCCDGDIPLSMYIHTRAPISNIPATVPVNWSDATSSWIGEASFQPYGYSASEPRPGGDLSCLPRGPGGVTSPPVLITSWWRWEVRCAYREDLEIYDIQRRLHQKVCFNYIGQGFVLANTPGDYNVGGAWSGTEDGPTCSGEIYANWGGIFFSSNPTNPYA